MKDTTVLLRQVLEKSVSNRVHSERIMNLSTLKEAHVYCKIHGLSGQFCGPMIETYIQKKYNMNKNSTQSRTGDLHCNGLDIEIKASIGGKEHNRFNYVQLRMNHSCIYILTAYYLDYSNFENHGELYIFKLNKEDIKNLILKYGSYAHGTVSSLGRITRIDLNRTDNKKEYAIRPRFGDRCWMDLLNYRIPEIVI